MRWLAVAAMGPAVSIFASSYAPPRVDVVAGDTVMWTDDSVLQHTVTAADGGWSSPRMFSGAMFEHRFDEVGATAYFCEVHPFMRGEVDVHGLPRAAPCVPGAPGRPFTVTGRAALAPGSVVSIEAAEDGAAFRRLAQATVDDHGGFRAPVTVATTTSLRAVAGADASPPVQLRVVDRRLRAAARSAARGAVVTASVTPAAPGATVVLQLRLRERFGWWPVRRARLGRDSRVRFSVRLRRPARGRVVLTLSDGATALARSSELRLGPRRRR
jgi:hypothetical protein